MKYRIIFRVSKEFLDDHGRSIRLVKSIIGNNRRKFLIKGIRLMNPVVQFGYDGDDFRQNRMSCITEFDGYKVPRFLKNHLLYRKTIPQQ